MTTPSQTDVILSARRVVFFILFFYTIKPLQKPEEMNWQQPLRSAVLLGERSRGQTPSGNQEIESGMCMTMGKVRVTSN